MIDKVKVSLVRFFLVTNISEELHHYRHYHKIQNCLNVFARTPSVVHGTLATNIKKYINSNLIFKFKNCSWQNAVYGVLQCDHEKLEYALRRSTCDVNYLQQVNRNIGLDSVDPT